MQKSTIVLSTPIGHGATVEDHVERRIEPVAEIVDARGPPWSG